ncbi:MAG: lipoate--protein ligase family protein [candidate division Zixibacteria bacterium]|nr:lipoate--protein ligase family protein [Candidatus Tariuqbacter arcticus]
MNIRFIDSPPQEGEFNMSCDYTLAVQAKPGDDALLRIYTWLEPTISIGFHQKAEDIDYILCEKDGISVVRRPTGGRAILHWGEITYCFIAAMQVGGGQKALGEIYRKAHTAIHNALRMHGLNVNFAAGKKIIRKQSPLCFATSVGTELEYEGKKVVGSAQRLLKSTVLQHGSILISPEHLKLPDYLNVSEELRQRLREKLELSSTHLPLRDDKSFRITMGKSFANIFEGKVYRTDLTSDENIQIGKDRPRFIINEFNSSV